MVAFGIAENPKTEEARALRVRFAQGVMTGIPPSTRFPEKYAMLAVRTCSAILVAFGVVIGSGMSAPSLAESSHSSIKALSVPNDWKLHGVVLLSRHGLRAPVDSIGDLDALTVSQWPNYGVKTGYLLPQGYERARTLGEFYRLYYTKAGLFPIDSGYCPKPSAATFSYDGTGKRQDPAGVQRVEKTAMALAEGMFPGCDLPVSAAKGTFGSSCQLDADREANAARKFVGGSWETVAEGELRKPLARMSKALGLFKESSCSGMPVTAGSTLSDYSATMTDEGPIGCADELSENFLMQYEAGFPIEEVAFGRLGRGKELVANLKTVNKIHALDFAAWDMPLYIAKRSSPQLASTILQSVNHIASNSSKTSKFLVLVGHDTQLLNIGGMLGSNWVVPSYNENQVPPAGAMIFEVWQTKSGPVVRSLFVAQKVVQMRENAKMTMKSPPGATRMPVAGCDDRHGACDLKQFTARLSHTILEECVGRASQ